MASATETLRQIFKDIANAIRGKSGTTEVTDKINPENYAARIKAIRTGTNTSDATATSGDIRSGMIAYISSGKVTGTMPYAGAIAGQLGTTSSPLWSTSDPNRGSGKVTITSVYQTAGYTPGRSGESFEIDIPANRLLKGRTIVPTTVTQQIAASEDIVYGDISVSGDENLVPSNIKSGVTIFGVTGSAGVSSDTSDATATASDIAEGLTAYGADGKITGSVLVVSDGSFLPFSGFLSDNYTVSGEVLRVKTNGLLNNRLFRPGSKIRFDMPLSDFGDVTASDVVSGKTFTSESGLKVNGKLILTSSIHGTLIPSNIIHDESKKTMTFKSGPSSSRMVLENDGVFDLYAPDSYFGDATAADVASGKTFTSSAGFKVTGTADSSKSSINVEIVNNSSVKFLVIMITSSMNNVSGGATISSGGGTRTISVPAYGAIVLEATSPSAYAEPDTIDNVNISFGTTDGLKSSPVQSAGFYVAVFPGYNSNDYVVTLTNK